MPSAGRSRAAGTSSEPRSLPSSGNLPPTSGAAEAIGVGSGTDAIHLALRTLGIGPGDGVVTVSHTAVATVAAIELAGAEPLLVDIDPSTFTMDVRSLEAAIASHRGRAPEGDRPGSPVRPSRRHAGDRGHRQAASAIRRSKIAPRPMAPRSDPEKSARGATSRASASTRRRTLARLATAARSSPTISNGRRERACCGSMGGANAISARLAGLNTRLDELQAAVLRAKLPHLDRENARRREIAAHYDAVLESTRLDLPRAAQGVTHVYHQYTVRTPYRDELAAFLNNRGIGAGILYPLPVHVAGGLSRAASGCVRGADRVRAGLSRAALSPRAPAIDGFGSRRGGGTGGRLVPDHRRPGAWVAAVRRNRAS